MKEFQKANQILKDNFISNKYPQSRRPMLHENIKVPNQLPKKNLPELKLSKLKIRPVSDPELEHKEKNEIKTSIRKRKKRNLKCIESWDNNLLKNILPQNITNRNKNEYNYQNKENNNYENNYKIKRIKGAYYRNNEYKTLNSVYNIKNKTKCDFAGKYKKLNNISLNTNKFTNTKTK